MWNGTAAILNPMPATIRMTASGSHVWCCSPPSSIAIDRRLVVAVRPYRIDIPYSRRPSEKVPSRKYFTAASFDRRLGLRNPTRM